MPISFPTSPATNDTYTYSGKTWTWTGSVWQANSTPIGYGNLDGGNATSVYGGLTAISGGNASGN